MTGDERIAALEAQIRALTDVQSVQGQLLRSVAAEAVRGRRSRDTAQAGDLVARLDPGDLSGGRGLRGARPDAVPDLGAPLLARLRDDAFLGGQAVGRIEPLGGYANVLKDPTLETMTVYSAATAAYVARGPHWEAKYVLNSGTVATTRDVGLMAIRSESDFAYGSSGVALIALVFGTDASDMTFYVRPSTIYAPIGVTVASWLDAAARVFASGLTANLTVSASVEIVDALDVALVSSDSEDLVALQGLAEQSRLEVGFEGPSIGDDYRWRLRVDVVKSAGSVASGSVYFSEPLLTFSDDGSAPVFTPAVGGWLPGLPGRHLLGLSFVASNIAAGASTDLDPSDAAMTMGTPRISLPWAGTVVGLSYRFSAVITAGACDLRSTVAGVDALAISGVTSGAAGQSSVAPYTHTFAAGDGIGARVVTGGGFLPTTSELDITVWLLVDYTGQ